MLIHLKNVVFHKLFRKKFEQKLKWCRKSFSKNKLFSKKF